MCILYVHRLLLDEVCEIDDINDDIIGGFGVTDVTIYSKYFVIHNFNANCY